MLSVKQISRVSEHAHSTWIIVTTQAAYVDCFATAAIVPSDISMTTLASWRGQSNIWSNMTSSRPSSAPLFQPPPNELYDGYTIDPGGEGLMEVEPGANQFLRGDSHAGESTKTSRSNRVQSGQIPRTSGPAIGSPDPVNPAGRGFSDSL